ncbi:MAG TPA: hypothetical protein DCX07_15315 [Phycisphaerales bacterium]|nr:hypothetical protein [Phycisphaerales bacterium]
MRAKVTDILACRTGRPRKLALYGAGFEGWLPRKVGPYTIHAFVAEGGMGIVLRGLDEGKDMPAAIKLLKSDAGGGWIERFQRESRTLQSLVHPNLIRLRDCGREGCLDWMATDWVDGVSLERLATQARSKGRPISLDGIRNLLRQVVAALDYLHGRGIVHRDLKPSNVLVARDGLAKLADLGIAKSRGVPGVTAVTMTGAAAGTAGYMSPEQCDGGPVGPASDVFALGMLWYDLVAGRRPVGVYRPMRMFNPDCPSRWDDLVSRCLSYDPAERPGIDEIAAVLTGAAPAGAERGKMVHGAAAAFLGKHSFLLGATIGILLLGTLFWGLYRFSDRDGQTDTAGRTAVEKTKPTDEHQRQAEQQRLTADRQRQAEQQHLTADRQRQAEQQRLAAERQHQAKKEREAVVDAAVVDIKAKIAGGDYRSAIDSASVALKTYSDTPAGQELSALLADAKSRLKRRQDDEARRNEQQATRRLEVQKNETPRQSNLGIAYDLIARESLDGAGLWPSCGHRRQPWRWGRT